MDPPSHPAPGAFSDFLLYDISMFGRNKKHAEAQVLCSADHILNPSANSSQGSSFLPSFLPQINGIVQSLVLAYKDLQLRQGPSRLTFAQGLLANASRNRSPSSYLANPAEVCFFVLSFFNVCCRHHPLWFIPLPHPTP